MFAGSSGSSVFLMNLHTVLHDDCTNSCLLFLNVVLREAHEHFISFHSILIYFASGCFVCLFIKISNKTPRIPDTLSIILCLFFLFVLSIFLSLKMLISSTCHFILLSNADILWRIHQLSPHLPHQALATLHLLKGKVAHSQREPSCCPEVTLDNMKTKAQKGMKLSCVSAQWGKRPALFFEDSGQREERVEGSTAVYIGPSDSILWKVIG